MTISGPGRSVAGDTVTLTCTVDVSIQPIVQWIHPNGTIVTNISGITVSLPERAGNITTLTLTFNPLSTSHGGPYTCQSEVNEALSTQNSTGNITVQSELLNILIVHALPVSAIRDNMTACSFFASCTSASEYWS